MNLPKTLLAIALVVPVALTGCGDSSDGHNNDSGQQYQFSGAVQKGPLQPGSVVTINELNDEFVATGVTHTTQIEDYAGNYSVNERFSGKFAELEVEGYYFNEITGSTDEQMTMSAFVDMSQINGANFNTATAVMKQSVMAQVQAGVGFVEAVDVATRNLLDIYSYDVVSSEGVNFYETNLTNAEDTSTILLAISATTLQMATDKGTTLEQEIENIGKVLVNRDSAEFTEMKDVLNMYRFSIYAGNTYENTKEYFTKNGLEFTIPHINYVIDVNGDGVLPSKDLPVFNYTSGVNIGSDEIGGLRPAGASAVDYQGRPMTFEVIGEFQHGEIASIKHRENGVSIEYRLTDVNFEGQSFEDCVTVNTVTPAPANFPWKACVTIVKNN
ncbi:hypothetical protein [Vibrio vulnificus]|uniref:hypothetical protein n=2 Tax=Vibrio vulnificus TaxID=672 RepID=UPI000501C8C2|nr:hypothetical protein [Vibrio vulnificus]KFK53949.1 lipoprotein [Vibrio vulnificus]MCU8546918.1 hypothetical protein [Vibrio vulnificus]MCU8578619.1 hypothetical protein [Vibrio vulnificus]